MGPVAAPTLTHQQELGASGQGPQDAPPGCLWNLPTQRRGMHLWPPQEPVSRHQQHAEAPAQQEEGSQGHWSVQDQGPQP